MQERPRVVDLPPLERDEAEVDERVGGALAVVDLVTDREAGAGEVVGLLVVTQLTRQEAAGRQRVGA